MACHLSLYEGSLGVILKMAEFDRSYTSFRSSAIVTMPVFYHCRYKARYWLKIAIFSYPFYMTTPWGQTSSVYSQLKRVTDRQTDRWKSDLNSAAFTT